MKPILLALFLLAPGLLHCAEGDIVSLGGNPDGSDEIFRLRVSSGLILGVRVVPRNNNEVSLGTATQRWLALYVTSVDVALILLPDADNGANIGSPDFRFSNLYVSTLNATAGVLPPGSTVYVQSNPSTEQTTTANITSITVNILRLDGAMEGQSGSIQAALLQGGSSSYAQIRSDLQAGASIYVLSSSASIGSVGMLDIWDRLSLSSSNAAGAITVLGKPSQSYIVGLTSNPTNGRYFLIVSTAGHMAINAPMSSVDNSAYLSILSFNDNTRNLLVLQNEGTGNSLNIGDVSGDPTPTIFDAAGGITTADWLRIRGTMTVSGSAVGIATDAPTSTFTVNGLVSSLQPCASGFTRRGLDECYDTDGIPSLTIVSSAVAAGGSGQAYATYDNSTLNTTNAKEVEIETHCDVTNDGGAGDSFIAPNARVTGGGGAGPGSAVSRRPGICNQPVASQNGYCNGVFSLGLNADKDVDLAVELIGSTSGTCIFYVTRYWD